MPLEAWDQALVLDLLKASDEAQGFVAGMDEKAFLADLKTQKAVEREFEIIGEAARSLGQAAREAYPKVPFRSMIGMRKILAHDYGRVDPKELWKTLKEALPELVKNLK